MKYSQTDKIKIAVFVICMILELSYLLWEIFGFGIFILYYEPGDAMYIALQSITILHAISLLIFSILGIRKIKQGKPALLSSFIKKLLASMIGFGCIYIPFGEPIAAACILGIAVGGIASWKILGRNNRESSTKPKPFGLPLFKCDKAKWNWDSAAKEYCKIYDKRLEDLTDDDNDKIYDYAGSPIAYFLAWIIKNDFYSERFKQQHSSDFIEHIKSEQGNPVEFLGSEMDYVFGIDDLSEEILPFVNKYYRLPMRYSGKYRHYWDDYFETICNDAHIVYCIDFSWDIYHRLEEKINKKYQYDQIENEENEEPITIGEVTWNLLNKTLTIEAMGDVSANYIGRCVNHLNHLSDSVIDDLCDVLLDWYAGCIDLCDKILDANDNKRKILEHLSPDCLTIYTPHGDEPAFVIGCEPDFEEEHGIAWSVRGNELLEVAYRCDVSTPWSYENEMAYRIANIVKEINATEIDSMKKTLKMAEQGFLKAIYLTPVKLNGEESEDNRVFVPQIIADMKEEYDTMVEHLLLDGLVDTYSCEPEYQGNSVVPSKLKIIAKKDAKVIFYEVIQIWR